MRTCFSFIWIFCSFGRFVCVSTSQHSANRMKIQMSINLFVIHHGFCAPSCIVYSPSSSFFFSFALSVVAGRIYNGRGAFWCSLSLFDLVFIICLLEDASNALALHLMQNPNLLMESFPCVMFIQTKWNEWISFLCFSLRLFDAIAFFGYCPKWMRDKRMCAFFPFFRSLSVNSFPIYGHE